MAVRGRVETGQQVSAKVMEGCIVLMTYGEQEQKLLAELKETQLKLKGVEAAVSATH